MKEKLQKYAELLIKTGINLKKDQILVIASPIQCSEFARIATQVAFEAGAKDVQIRWIDEEYSKIRYLMGSDDLFNEIPSWLKEFQLSYVRQDAAFLSILASDPDIFEEVDPLRMQNYNRAYSIALKEYRDRMMNNVNTWCVASIPTAAWANKVFPNVGTEEAIEQLWQAIFKAVRVDEANPVAAWDVHKKNLSKSVEILNGYAFEKLHYTSSNGTDLTIELPKNHIWMGGADFTKDGHEFVANMPTEEVFTAPLRTGINGKVVSSMPLAYNGKLIDDFQLIFENGKIVDFSAAKGYESLKGIIETDEGSHYLGEVALVPYHSPIADMNILFYNSLFDENAACHLAIGKAYPVCVAGGEEMNSEELIKNGINDSMAHVDFMIGTKDLNIVGYTSQGEKIQVFSQGNFAF